MKKSLRFALAVAFGVAFASPVNAQQTPGSRRSWTTEIQGFNIVLLVGESQGTSGPVDDLPQGARRALNDMKEFLPYKSYRVLDSQWTSCCAAVSQTFLNGRLQGVTGIGGGSELRLVPRTYGFSLQVSEAAAGLQVHFSLREEDGGGQAAEHAAAVERQLQHAIEDHQIARQRMEEMKKRVAVGTMAQSDLRPHEDQVRELERKVQAIRQDAAAQRGGKSGGGVISSSFNMSIGETVVVGTSRLGGDKALIALVTAAKRGDTGRR